MVQLLRLLLLETKHYLRSKCCSPENMDIPSLRKSSFFTLEVSPLRDVCSLSLPLRDGQQVTAGSGFQLGTAQATTNIGTNAAST